MEFSQQSLIDIIFCLSIVVIPLVFIVPSLVAESVDTQYSSRHKWRTVYPNRTRVSITITFGNHSFSNLETSVIDRNIFKRYRYGVLRVDKGGSCERRRVYLDLQNVTQNDTSNEHLTITKIEYRPVDSMRKTLNGYESPEQKLDIDGEIRITLSQMKGGSV